jgi:hypothetical protein
VDHRLVSIVVEDGVSIARRGAPRKKMGLQERKLRRKQRWGEAWEQDNMLGARRKMSRILIDKDIPRHIRIRIGEDKVV